MTLWPSVLIACIVVAVAWPARAQDELPGRVGRVANVQGTLQRASAEDAGNWTEIGLNHPIAQGHDLWMDRDGRAEIDYGGGQFRIAGDTNLHVSRLDDRQLALFMAAGRLIVRVRTLEPDDSVRIDTPATQIALARPGLYRIDVASDSPQTTVVVREGEAELAGAAGTVPVYPGQTASLSGVAGEPADVRSGAGIDAFDAWSAARDRVYEAPRQDAYVSRQMVGAADLDVYGTWQTYPDYGAVWFPASVAPEWAPYRHGHWTWLRGWGYTWVDDAPWGYAPFHYGRWAFIGGRWGWCPGTLVARPVWAPALVAWYGGAGWPYSASYGGPVYGWVPLGWREPFIPWWGRCASRCFARYNRPYAVDGDGRRSVPPAHYVNWNAPGGITAVAAPALTGGKPVAINRVPVGTNAAFTPSLVTRPPAVKPVAPVRPVAVPGNVAPPPASTLFPSRTPPASRAVIAPVTPPNSNRAPTLPVGPAPSPVERGVRSAPLPPPVPPAAVRPPVSQVPADVPRAAPPARAASRAAPVPGPAPSAAAPSPVPPQAVAPAPRGAIRAAPPNPGAADR